MREPERRQGWLPVCVVPPWAGLRLFPWRYSGRTVESFGFKQRGAGSARRLPTFRLLRRVPRHLRKKNHHPASVASSRVAYRSRIQDGASRRKSAPAQNAASLSAGSPPAREKVGSLVPTGVLCGRDVTCPQIPVRQEDNLACGKRYWALDLSQSAQTPCSLTVTSCTSSFAAKTEIGGAAQGQRSIVAKLEGDLS